MLNLLATLLVLHLDFNTVQMKAESVVDALRVAAKAGYNAVLWEVENKVRWETCPECVDAEAFSKDEFRKILAEADRLGLEPIPLFQTFGHAEYVLRHAKYAPWKEAANFPSCYCVSNPEVVAFQKAMLREYRDLFGPKMKRVHLGGDEAYVFGTCPKCREHDKMKLYASHLVKVTEELRAAGVRPGVWADMVLMGGDWKRYGQLASETLGTLPRDFTLWQWDYVYGTRGKSDCPAKVDALVKTGYEVIVSCSSHSCGDSPFLPRYRYHRDNIAASAALVRDRHLAGLCMTSWSVHLSEKALQYPLWEFGAKRLTAPGPDAAADFEAIVTARWGRIPFETLADISTWQSRLTAYDSRIPRGIKAGDPAPKGFLKGRLAELDAKRGRREGLLADIASTRTAIRSARSALPAKAPAALGEGAALDLAFLEAVEAVVRGRMPTIPLDATRRYYGLWQPPLSAARATELAWSALEQAEGNGAKP